MEKKRSIEIGLFGTADIILGSFGLLPSLFLFLVQLMFIKGCSADFDDFIANLTYSLRPLYIFLYIFLAIGFFMLIKLGISILKLKPVVMKMKSYLTPFLIIIISLTLEFFNRNPNFHERISYKDIKNILNILDVDFWFVPRIIILITLYFLLHLWFFTRPKVKEQFN